MGMGMENLIRKSVEDQTAVMREMVAVLGRIEAHLAWQSQWMARQEHPAEMTG
jgi:NADH:ubiquinone oxidoreductase subunit D